VEDKGLEQPVRAKINLVCWSAGLKNQVPFPLAILVADHPRNAIEGKVNPL
jgi:hypothetical protein